ncbi:ribbon-helix-helix protein, CopG family, partial [Acidobacteria bacterium AH-259-G07]|nr:ribbon-helix-helix protein, CopG family [Acidobacteria bacterium AH-259-G07]
MIKTTVYLEEETAVALRQLAAARRQSQAALIREALKEFTYKVPRTVAKGIGGHHSGRSDVSER